MMQFQNCLITLVFTSSLVRIINSMRLGLKSRRGEGIQTVPLVYLTMFVLGIGQSIEFALMPMLGRELGLDKLVIDMPALGIYYYPKELAITVLASVTALSFSLCTPFWGRLSDRYGRKPFIILGLVGYCLGVLLFSWVAWLGLKSLLTGFALFLGLFVVRTFHSAIKSAAFPSSNAFIIDSSTLLQRTKALGGLAASSQIGSMCGPVLAFLVVLHFLAPLWLMGLITGLLAILLFVFLRPPQPHGHALQHDLEIPKKSIVSPLRYLDVRYRAFVVLCFLTYTSMGMVQQTLGFYFQDTLNLTPIAAAKQYSLSMVVSSFAMLVAQLGIVQRVKVHPTRFIVGGLPCLLLGFMLLGFAADWFSLLGGMALFGFALGLIGPSLAAAASERVLATEQGGLSGIMSSVSGLGFVVGPLIGGLVYSVKAEWTYFLAAALVFVLILIIFIKNYFLNDKALAKV